VYYDLKDVGLTGDLRLLCRNASGSEHPIFEPLFISASAFDFLAAHAAIPPTIVRHGCP